MELLTVGEAAEALSDGLGRPVGRGEVKDAVKRGRLRAEKKPGLWGGYRIPRDEVQRVLEEHCTDKTLSGLDELRAHAWDLVPRSTGDVLWRSEWKSWRR
jgi:excisionase family DNA binding protein